MYYTHQFMGHGYEVVNGSQRDMCLRMARVAVTMGHLDVAIKYHLRAIAAPGCARAHRLGVRHG